MSYSFLRRSVMVFILIIVFFIGNESYGLGDISDLSSGGDHTCAIHIDGTIACWGYNNAGQTNAPYGLFTQVSSSLYHSCGILTDGTIPCWGFNGDGRSMPPFGIFSQVSVGGDFSCAIRTDGTLVCWGGNGYGQSTPPLGSTFTQIAAGYAHSCAIRTDGTLACWGSNFNGESNPPQGTFTQITSGKWYSCAIRTDGTLACWGSNWLGPLNAPSGTFIQVAAGEYTTCAIRTDGTLACWGDNSYGQTNVPTDQFIYISLGLYHVCGIKRNNTITCWGTDWFGESSVPTGFILKGSSMSSFSLLSSTPTDGATNIPTNGVFGLTFSAHLDQSTVPGNIVLEKTGLQSISTQAISYTGGIITFHATSPLDKNTSYTIRLKTGLKDTSGDTLGDGKTISFTTGSEPVIPGVDNTIASTALSPSCSSIGYSIAHPECSILNNIVIGSNNEVVYNGAISIASPAGDPVSLPTGEFTYSNTIMHVSGDGLDYSLSLSYKSQAYSNGPVGISWDHSYNISLRENVDNSVTYSDGKFGTYTFTKTESGSTSFSRIPGIEADLVKADTGYELRFTNGTTYVFGTNLKIVSIRDKDNHALSFAYDTDNKLTSTTDTLGHVFAYDYYDHGRLKSVTDFSGRSVVFNYYTETDTDGSAYDLKSITINNGDTPKTISFTYQKDPVSEVLSHNILTLTDSSGKEYVKNVYDENDRVISQKYGDGTLYYSYETTGGAGDDKNHITKTTATNKRGMKSEFSYDANGNTLSKKLFDGDKVLTTTYTYAPNGKIASETKPLGNGTSYLYDSQNRIIEKRLKADMAESDNDTNDIVTKYEYSTNFSVPIKITDPAGNIITTTLDTKGNLIETKVLGVKKADGSTHDMVNSFTYDSNGHLITKTDGVGNATKYEYENGRLVKTIEGSGDETVNTLFSYDTHGNLLSVTDGEGNIKKFTYDQYDRLIASLSAEGILQETSYDANNNKTEQKVNLENGKILKNTSTYDILDQIVGDTIGTDSLDQRATNIVRDANGNITETTDARGLKTRYVYDILDRVIEKTVAENITTKYAYDQNGNIVSSTDPRNVITLYSYDRFDRMTTSTDTLGTKTSLIYDKSGNIVSMEVKDQTGKPLSKTERLHDNLGHMIRETIGASDGNTGITTVVDYDANGKPVKMTDAKGNSTTVIYDSLGRKKSVTDALGNQTILTYDKRGLVVKQEVKSTDGKSIVSLFGYDKDGRLTTKTDGLGDKTVSLYNKLGQVVQVTDANGNKTDYAYDVFGNILSETKYLNGTPLKTSYEYDTSNNRTKLTDANGNITTYVYDSVNRLIKETIADGSFVSYEYDTAGNITKKTDANGTVVSNTYDQLGRLVKRTIARGTNVLGVTEENYTYDPLGRLIGSTDSDGNILVFTYDSFGRLISETQNGKTVQTGYDPNGNITSLIYPSGKKAVRDYDVLNRLTGISLDGKNVANYGYNPLTLDSLTLANGAKTTYGYDALLRLKELTNIGIETVGNGKKQTTQEPIINKLSFSYDQVSNILSNGENNYSYDSINQLTSVDKGDELVKDLDSKKQEKLSIDYNYDNLGNRDSVEQTLFWTTKKGKEKEKTKIADYTNNSLNQYISVSSLKRDGDDEKHGNSGKFVYDKNENLIQDSNQKYSYDYRNRLIKVVSYDTDKKGKITTSPVADFQYDVLGRRTTKTTYNDEDEAKKVVRYVYSNQDIIEENIFVIRDGKEKLKEAKEYIYGKGMDDVISVISTTPSPSFGATAKNPGKNTVSAYFYQKDQLGSITAITNERGMLVEEYKYDEFGKPYARAGKSDNWKVLKTSSIGNTKLFTGREYDKEIGLYYYRARYYSADLGRFISRDPIGTADNVNLYTYVGNSPVMYVDGMGREKALFIKNNEGNAWYLEQYEGFTDTVEHSILLFIEGGQARIVSYYPIGAYGTSNYDHESSYYVNQALDYAMVNGQHHANDVGITTTSKEVNITYIDDAYVNTSSILSWYNSTRSSTDSNYNVITNNCANNVSQALVSGGFFNENIGGGLTPSRLTEAVRLQDSILRVFNQHYY